MTQSVLMVLATCLGLCAANSMMINDGILISALVFAILGCLLACVLMSYAFYMQRKRKGKGAEELNQSLVGGGYGDNGGHDHHLHSGSRGYGYGSWYQDGDDYAWWWIAGAVFCCLFFAIVVGVVVWAVTKNHH